MNAACNESKKKPAFLRSNMQDPQAQHKKKRCKLTPYILILPSIVLFTMFTFWPFLKTIILSFSYRTTVFFIITFYFSV